MAAGGPGLAGHRSMSHWRVASALSMWVRHSSESPQSSGMGPKPGVSSESWWRSRQVASDWRWSSYTTDAVVLVGRGPAHQASQSGGVARSWWNSLRSRWAMAAWDGGWFVWVDAVAGKRVVPCVEVVVDAV